MIPIIAFLATDARRKTKLFTNKAFTVHFFRLLQVKQLFPCILVKIFTYFGQFKINKLSFICSKFSTKISSEIRYLFGERALFSIERRRSLAS